MSLLAILLKLSLLAIAGKSFMIALTPPNPPAQKKVRGNFFETYVHQICTVMKSIFGMTLILDAVSTVVASGLLDPGLTRSTTDLLGAHICPSAGSSFAIRELSSTSLLPSNVFVLSTALLAMSAMGRLWCYRTLGKQFRYEVSLQEKHRLVTSGPYAFVRHPSYLALYGTYVGSLGLLAARGTWSRECVLQAPYYIFLSTLGGSGKVTDLLQFPVAQYGILSLMALWFVTLVSVERNLAGRLHWEDVFLKNEFGKEWVEYAQRVPWRIVPFVF